MPATDFAALRQAVTGTVVEPGDPRYDAARRVWNGDIDRRPAAVLRCRTEADVSAAVRFAAGNDVVVSVRGGGHSFPGLSTCDGGLVIDLGALDTVTVDPDRRRARAGGGTLLGGLDAAAQAHGQATPAGVVSHTGIAGLTLGGGYGYLSRRWGLTCDNLRSVDIVGADGELRTVDDRTEPDLMWALRGGGGNFGIVTAFEYDTYPLGPVLTGWLLHPWERAGEFMRFFRDWSADMPDELCALLRVRVPGDTALFPAVDRDPAKAYLGVSVTWSGDHTDGLAHLATLRSWGRPAVDTVSARPYCDLQRSIDGGAVPGVRRYELAGYVEGVSDAMIDTLVARLDDAPASAEVSLFSLGGATARVGEDDTAYSCRTAPFQFEARVAWTDPAERADLVAWTRATRTALDPHAVAGRVYVNLVMDEGADRIRTLYGATKFARLQAVKTRWDPTNLFRLNQNIPPLS
jgi:FAD/FMN-containing dehydrogenase